MSIMAESAAGRLRGSQKESNLIGWKKWTIDLIGWKILSIPGGFSLTHAERTMAPGIDVLRIGVALAALCSATVLYSLVSREVMDSLPSHTSTIPYFILGGSIVQAFVMAFFAAVAPSSSTPRGDFRLSSLDVWLRAAANFFALILTYATYSLASSFAAVESVRAAEPFLPLLLVAFMKRRAKASEGPWWWLASAALLFIGAIFCFFSIAFDQRASVASVLMLGLCANLAHTMQDQLHDKDGASQFSVQFASFLLCVLVFLVYLLFSPSCSLVHAMHVATVDNHLVMQIAMWIVAGVTLAVLDMILSHCATWLSPTGIIILSAIHHAVCIVGACIVVPGAVGGGIAMLCIGIILLVAGFALHFRAVQAEQAVLPMPASDTWGSGAAPLDIAGIIIGIAAVCWIIVARSTPVVTPSYVSMPILLNGSSVDGQSASFNLACFDFPGNLGDTGVHLACERLFAEVASEEGLIVNIIQKESATSDTIMVYGGGSLLATSWAQQRWFNLAGRSMDPHRWRYPLFYFGGGYDDNDVSWTSNTTMLDIVLRETEEVTAGDGSKDIDMSSFSTTLSLPQQSCTLRLYWPIVMPNLVYGGVRGPLTARILTTLASETSLSMPASSRVIGDSGCFINRYVDTSLDLTTRLDLADKPFVLILAGKSSDGQFLVGANQKQSEVVRQEEEALRDFGVYAANQGYKVALIAMAGLNEDIEQLASLHDGIRARVNASIGDNVVFDSESPSLENLLGLIQQAHVVVAHKLHGGVFAGAFGTPFISIAYRLKHYDWALSLDATDLVVRISDVTADSLIDRFNYILADYDSIRDRLLAKAALIHGKFKEEARRFLRDAALMSSGGPLPHRAN